MYACHVIYERVTKTQKYGMWTEWLNRLKAQTQWKGPPLVKTQQKQTNEVKGIEFKQFSLEGKRNLLPPAANPLWNTSTSKSTTLLDVFWICLFPLEWPNCLWDLQGKTHLGDYYVLCLNQNATFPQVGRTNLAERVQWVAWSQMYSMKCKQYFP